MMICEPLRDGGLLRTGLWGHQLGEAGLSFWFPEVREVQEVSHVLCLGLDLPQDWKEIDAFRPCHV